MSTPARQKTQGVFADVERIFALQRAHQWEMKATTAEQRKEKLRKLKSAVEAHGDDIVAAVKQDTRKPENEIRVTELLNVLANIERNISNLDEWMKPIEVVPSLNKSDRAKIVYEARGVCLILGPWNIPLGLVTRIPESRNSGYISCATPAAVEWIHFNFLAAFNCSARSE